jgi:hypothetical protein
MNSKWCEDVWDGQTIFIGKKKQVSHINYAINLVMKLVTH